MRRGRGLAAALAVACLATDAGVAGQAVPPAGGWSPTVAVDVVTRRVCFRLSPGECMGYEGTGFCEMTDVTRDRVAAAFASVLKIAKSAVSSKGGQCRDDVRCGAWPACAAYLTVPSAAETILETCTDETSAGRCPIVESVGVVAPPTGGVALPGLPTATPPAGAGGTPGPAKSGGPSTVVLWTAIAAGLVAMYAALAVWWWRHHRSNTHAGDALRVKEAAPAPVKRTRIRPPGIAAADDARYVLDQSRDPRDVEMAAAGGSPSVYGGGGGVFESTGSYTQMPVAMTPVMRPMPAREGRSPSPGSLMGSQRIAGSFRAGIRTPGAAGGRDSPGLNSSSVLGSQRGSPRGGGAPPSPRGHRPRSSAVPLPVSPTGRRQSSPTTYF